MPHSTQGSVASRQTFDLTGQDHPFTPRSDSTMQASSRPSQDMYGTAVSSSPPNNMVDPRATLPSQQDVLKLRRRSMPGTVTDFVTADMFHNRGQIEGVIGNGYSGPYPGNGPQIPAMPAPPAMPGYGERSYSYNDMARRRTQYYEDQFQYKDNTVKHTRERAHKQSPVIAELKTNVIIKDEFTLVTDLSYQLAQRYTRPDSSIMIRVDHSACLALGGTFDPCYMLTINTVSSQMGPSTNKRNAALIQSFMADILSVPAERGIVTFMPIPEENLATCGNTILGEMEKAEKQDPGMLKRALNDGSRKNMANRKSMSRVDSEPIANGILRSSESMKDVKRDSDESDKSDRPRTAHGPYAAAGAANGLRMNPVSQDEIRGQNMRPPITRPKSIGAPTAAMQEMLRQQPREPIPMPTPNISRQSTPGPRAPAPQRTPQPQMPRSNSANNVNQKPKHIPIDISRNGNQAPLAPRPVPAQQNPFLTSQVTPFSSAPTTMTKVSAPTADGKRNKAVYLDMVSALPVKSEPNILKVEEVSPQSPKQGDTIAAANMAKRRSTVTAAPKVPPEIPPPPAVPSDDTKSMTSRLGKRKSLLKIFKRESTIPPWYKQ